MPSTVILGTGSYAPARVLTNGELAHAVDTSDEWIVRRNCISVAILRTMRINA